MDKRKIIICQWYNNLADVPKQVNLKQKHHENIFKIPVWMKKETFLHFLRMLKKKKKEYNCCLLDTKHGKVITPLENSV